VVASQLSAVLLLLEFSLSLPHFYFSWLFSGLSSMSTSIGGMYQLPVCASSQLL
jgi:hypothetical protein